MSSTEIASYTESTEDSSFYSRHKVKIFIVALIVVCIIVFVLFRGGTVAKTSFASSDVSTKIGALINSINEKQAKAFSV